MGRHSTKLEHLSSDKMEQVYSSYTKGNLAAEATATVAIALDRPHFGFYAGLTTGYHISILQEGLADTNKEDRRYDTNYYELVIPLKCAGLLPRFR